MNVFVSYSPVDNELVSAILSVLSAGNSALAYCDADSMRTGNPARDELRTAIAQTDVVLLFWCQHAFTSYEVRKENSLATEQGKDILPLLLDATPLPRNLADRPSVDLRDRVGPMHEQSPDQAGTEDVAARAEVDRLIASDMARQYEDLLVMSLAREIEAALASKLGIR